MKRRARKAVRPPKTPRGNGVTPYTGERPALEPQPFVRGYRVPVDCPATRIELDNTVPGGFRVVPV